MPTSLEIRQKQIKTTINSIPHIPGWQTFLNSLIPNNCMREKAGLPRKVTLLEVKYTFCDSATARETLEHTHQETRIVRTALSQMPITIDKYIVFSDNALLYRSEK